MATDSDITVELDSTKITEVATWMSNEGDGGPLSNADLGVEDAPDEILIKVTTDITVASSCAPDKLPAMTTGSDGNKYLFDFTDKRFKDKTINHRWDKNFRRMQHNNHR